jgi:membrane fusion protein (multidrug efflux system)
MLAQPGTQIGTLDDTSLIKLDFDIPETQLSKMKKNTPLVAKTAAYPDREFDGKINEVDSRVNTTTRTVRVRALLPNVSGALRPGMLLTVEVRSGAQQGLSVPENSVAESADMVSVYKVAQSEGGAARAVQTTVTVGRRQDGQIEILNGLKPGDRIISSGVVQIRDGQPVRIANAEGAARGPGAGQGGAAGQRPGAGQGAGRNGGQGRPPGGGQRNGG